MVVVGRTEKSVNILSLLFGICGLMLLCSLPLYVAYPFAWLPFGLVLFPFGSGFPPVFSIISGLGLLPIGNLPTLVPVSFMVFYGIVELIISFGLYRRAEWIRVTVCMVSMFIIFNVIASWLFQSNLFAAIAYAVFGAFIIWYMTRDYVKECF